jgi:predicted unusual protein kinase regulating ubiquinone biosynthesis (AarF/ABC1/UbiB family)
MEVAQPFAMQLMSNGNGSDAGSSIFNEIGRQAAQVSSTALALPRRIEETIDKLEQGDLRIRVRSAETERLIRRMTSVQMGTNYALLMSAFTLSATILFVSNQVWPAVAVALLAAGAGFGLLRLFKRIDRLDRMS